MTLKLVISKPAYHAYIHRDCHKSLIGSPDRSCTLLQHLYSLKHPHDPAPRESNNSVGYEISVLLSDLLPIFLRKCSCCAAHRQLLGNPTLDAPHEPQPPDMSTGTIIQGGHPVQMSTCGKYVFKCSLPPGVLRAQA